MEFPVKDASWGLWRLTAARATRRSRRAGHYQPQDGCALHATSNQDVFCSRVRRHPNARCMPDVLRKIVFFEQLRRHRRRRHWRPERLRSRRSRRTSSIAFDQVIEFHDRAVERGQKCVFFCRMPFFVSSIGLIVGATALRRRPVRFSPFGRQSAPAPRRQIGDFGVASCASTFVGMLASCFTPFASRA